MRRPNPVRPGAVYSTFFRQPRLDLIELNEVTAGVPKNGAARFSLWWCDRDSWFPANRYIQPNRRIARSGFARSRVEVSERVLSQILLRSSLQQRQSLPASVAMDLLPVGPPVIPKLARLDPPL